MTGRHIDQGSDDTLQHDPFDDDLTERVAALAPAALPPDDARAGRPGRARGRFRRGHSGPEELRPGGAYGRGQHLPGEPAGGRAFPGQAGQGRGNQSTSATTGTVKLVDGTTVYLTLANGDIATVKTSDSTAVAVQQSAALKDLKVGQTVTVQGTAGTDGIISATRVTAEK